MADHPRPSAASYDAIPGLEQWKKLSFVGSLFSALRRNDPGLGRIDMLVEAHERAVRNGASAGERQYLLGGLFFATMHWNNHYKNDKRMEAARRPSILSLNLTAAKVLCAAFQCQPGGLPAKLNQLFGKGMTDHGLQVDRNDTGHYLDAAKRESFRVGFLGGRLHRFQTLRPDAKSPPVALDTQEYANLMDQHAPDNRAGDCGYALSMSHELYVGPLLGKAVKQWATQKGLPVFHSSFMAGKAVLCAGMITVRNGMPKLISTASGHYQPVDTSLVKVLQVLQMGGVSLRQIEINGHLEYGNVLSSDGEAFLRANGSWANLSKSKALQY